MIKLKFQGKEYPIKITYFQAINELPKRFDIYLTKLFTDPEAAEKTMQTLALDDEKTLDLMWFYIEESAVFDKDDFLKQVEAKDLDTFREDFWSAVVNFSGPLKKNLMSELWNQFKKDLKKADLESLTLNVSHSDYSQEE